MLHPLLVALRPKQWIKNLFVFAPVIFAARFFDPSALMRTFVLFLVFCLIAGSVYLFNDIIDREQDRVHPLKCRRLIAAGRLSTTIAALFAIGLSVIGLLTGTLIAPLVGLYLWAYLGYNVLYSLFFKHLIIVDVILIALGFVIRVMAGGVIVGIPPSFWMLLATFLLALFLGFGKRRAELMAHPSGSTLTRVVLSQYSELLLDHVLIALLTMIPLVYCLFTVFEVVTPCKTGHLLPTVPFVVYGLCRYTSLIQSQTRAEEFADLLYTDRPLQSCLCLWGITVLWILYHR